MTRRPGVNVVVHRPADGGEVPNAHINGITIDMRVFWPPPCTDNELREALSEAFIKLIDGIRAKRGGI